ncbi:MAG: hypothetical protein B6V02_01940 [Thermoprotei archaeon ex4572_64]|nr:MAG: hypothetical protein B6V02_01940 [Thermoprotei archaeon ex4572_64]
MFDIAIVGAGPSGLFAAYEIVKTCLENNCRLNIIILDKGRRARERKCSLHLKGTCNDCKPCNIMYGVGGAGTLSSGIINLRPDIGGELHEFTGSWELAMKIVNYVDSIFVKFGAPSDRIYNPFNEEFKEFQRKFIKVGAQLIPIKQRHIGTDRTVHVIENITQYLEENGVKIFTKTEVFKIDRDGENYRLTTSNGSVKCKVLLVAPGRGGAEWFRDEARRLGIEMEPNPLDVGVRVEVPYAVMEPLTNIYMDPKIIVYTKTYDDKVRTFCTNPGGYVVKEVYSDGTIGVNGETYIGKRSLYTNFAILVSVRLAIHKIDNVLPGLASKHTLLYAPEIKYYSMRVVTNRFLESCLEGLFVAGDGVGLSRGLNIAAATGIIAAWGILNKLDVKITNELYYEYSGTVKY